MKMHTNKEQHIKEDINSRHIHYRSPNSTGSPLDKHKKTQNGDEAIQ